MSENEAMEGRWWKAACLATLYVVARAALRSHLSRMDCYRMPAAAGLCVVAVCRMCVVASAHAYY